MMLDYVRTSVPIEKQWVQLAEEATELAHAALKVCRTLDDTNPTPVSFEEAMEKVHEELADVRLAVMVLNLDNYSGNIDHTKIMGNKLLRWVERLESRGGNVDG
jgi:hypothetical protein